MLRVTINAKSLSNSIDCDQPTTDPVVALNESAHTHMPFGLNEPMPLQRLNGKPDPISREWDKLRAVADLVENRGNLLVLTGAGCSTASGIPDYRDPDGRWKHSQPIRYQEFVGSQRTRPRYWARSRISWRRVERASPNPAHWSLAAMERVGLVHQLVTQNVDGLHQRAGHRRVLDLHGRLAWVDCLDCGFRLPRSDMQRRLETANPGFHAGQALSAPDGDAQVSEKLERSLIVPACPQCEGILKPAVVFFGENVPRSRVEHVRRKLRNSGTLLVAGSSLTVFSGFRFCREAAEHGIPIVILNRGQTPADELAVHKLDAEVGGSLLELAAILGVEVSVQSCELSEKLPP
jgi:NAD-dependent SIR2 family protein deacetylase